MKNVNLTGLYLSLVAEFGVTSFELSSIVPTTTNEPIDAMIDFNSRLDNVDFDVEKLQSIVNDNIIGDVKQATVKIQENVIHVYIEF
jgi:hypothetical protein